MFVYMDNLNHDDFKSICRICMNECFVKFVQDCIISDIFYKLTEMHFETSNELPQQICLNCFEKVIEIHEFSLQCKRTHTKLIKCLSKFKNNQINKKQNTNKGTRGELRILLERNVTTIQHEVESVEDESLNATDNNIKDEVKVNQITDNSDNELNFDVHPETSDFNEDDSLTSDNVTSNISLQNGGISNSNASVDDLNKRLNKSKEKKYKCDVCNKRFRYLSWFNKHKKLLYTNRQYKSNSCSKSLNLSSHLKENLHTRTRSNERLYKCDECSKTFNQLGNLKVHMRLHTGERPYKCKHCSKSFNQSGDLKRHMRTHSGERPFKCDQCFKSFSDSSILKRHILLHTGERSYKCKHCSKSYNRIDRLNMHMRTHSNNCILNS